MTTDFPSRELLRQQLLAAGRETQAGASWLLLGEPRSGKTTFIEMLHAYRDRRHRLPVRLSAGGGVMSIHQSGLLDDIAELGPLVGHVASLLANVTSFLGSPAAGVAGGVAAGANASGTVANRVAEHSDRVLWRPGRVREFLRGLDQPLLILVDDLHKLDQVDWWWTEFFGPLLGDIRAGANHLLVATAAWQPFDPDAVQRKRQSGLQIRNLPPLNSDDIEILTGPIDERLALAIVEASRGQPGPVIELWSGLQREGHVQQQSGQWVLDKSHPEAADLMMAELIRTLVNAGRTAEMEVVELALRLAAVCGSVFTVEAVVEAVETDVELTEIFRQMEAIAATTPLVYEVEPIVLESGLCLTRFGLSERLRDALAMLPSMEEDHQRVIWSLGETLMMLYGPMNWLVAGDAMYLFRLAGDQGRFMQAALLNKELAPQDHRQQLDILLDLEVEGPDAGDAHALALAVLVRIEPELETAEVLEYEERMAALASRSGDEAVRIGSLASLASALANDRQSPGSQRRAQKLAETVLRSTAVTGIQRLGALFALGKTYEVSGNGRATLLVYRDFEQLARHLDHGSAVAQGLAQQATAYLMLADHEGEPGKYDSEVQALHEEFDDLAGVDNRGRDLILRQKIEMAARVGDLSRCRILADELLQFHVEHRNLKQAVKVALQQSEREAEWFRETPLQERDPSYLQASVQLTISLVIDLNDEPSFQVEVIDACTELVRGGG